MQDPRYHVILVCTLLILPLDMVKLICYCRPHFDWPYSLTQGVSQDIVDELTNPPPMDPTQYSFLWEAESKLADLPRSVPPPRDSIENSLRMRSQSGTYGPYLHPTPYRELVDPIGSAGPQPKPAYIMDTDRKQDFSLYSLNVSPISEYVLERHSLFERKYVL